jgi:hypothetical protein
VLNRRRRNDALKELLRKKQKGEKIERPKEPARTNVVNHALRRSVAEGKEATTKAKKGRKRTAGQGEMLLPIPRSKEQGNSKARYSEPHKAKEGWMKLRDQVMMLCSLRVPPWPTKNL